MALGETLRARLRDTWLHPRYIGTVYLRPLLAAASVHASGIMIDIGCGHRQYEALFQDRVTQYVGLDLPINVSRACPDVIGDAASLPLHCECADTVLATEVMEHLPRPDDFLSEIWRILRAGGVLILSVPFLEPIHEEPRDFLRFTPYGIRSLLERHGFDVLTLTARGGWWSVVIGSFVNQTLYEWGNPLDASGGRRRRLLGSLVLPICAAAQFSGYMLDRAIASRRYTLGYVAVARRRPDCARQDSARSAPDRDKR